MTNNRSPGTSGFACEFYKVFWNKLGDFICRATNYSYKKGELSTTQKQGIITLIPKENKSRNFLKNYRPISLLNTIYKWHQHQLQIRIKTVLDKLIKCVSTRIHCRAIYGGKY